MQKYYKAEDLQGGIYEDGIQVIPPFSKTLLKNLRHSRRISYQKLGRECVYTRKNLEDYLESTIVETKNTQTA